MTDARVLGRSAPVWFLGHAAGMPGGDWWLTRAERRAQERFVVPKRRADWRLGRWTAKEAVSAWVGGTEHGRIGVLARSADDGYPVLVGAGSCPPRLSLTHRGSMAVAAVGPGGTALGCDLERVEPRSCRFPSDWFTPAEQQRVAHAPSARRDELVALTWSVKESALKAIGEGLRMDTRMVETDLGAPEPGTGSWAQVRADVHGGATLEGWWRPVLGHVLVIVADPGTLQRPPGRLWPGGADPVVVDGPGPSGWQGSPGVGDRPQPDGTNPLDLQGIRPTSFQLAGPW